MTALLEGLKILDFSTLLPGPCATMMLADMGAQVLRVESPNRLDLLRMMAPKQGQTSASHAYLNRSKRSLALDLKKPGAAEIIYQLIETYDVIVEQFRPGVMQRLGLDFQTLKAKKPNLIYCSITGFGQTGPLKDRPGHDINYLALSGVSSYTGSKEGGPAPVGVQIADVAGGSHHAVMGILAAVIKRMRTGEGEYIDVSMADASLALNHMSMAGFLADGQDPGWEDQLLNGAGIYDYYETADKRYLAVGALEPQFVQQLCSVLGIPNQASLLISQKTADQQKAKQLLRRCFIQRTLGEWQEKFAGFEACVEPVLRFSEALEHPHFASRKLICEVQDAEDNRHSQLAHPIKYEGYQSEPAFSGVALGAHTVEVMEELGKSQEEVALLRKSGVFG